MKKYECSICGNIHDETIQGPVESIWQCPVCGAPRQTFLDRGEVRLNPNGTPAPAPPAQPGPQNTGGGAVYTCSICGNIYDENINGAWDQLPPTWQCPVCGAPGNIYQMASPATQPAPMPPMQDAPPAPPMQPAPPQMEQPPIMVNTPQQMQQPAQPEVYTQPPIPEPAAEPLPHPVPEPLRQAPPEAPAAYAPPAHEPPVQEPPAPGPATGRRSIFTYHKFECSICGNVYDEHMEASAFGALPDTWECPHCGASKSSYFDVEIGPSPEQQEMASPINEPEPKIQAEEPAPSEPVADSLPQPEPEPEPDMEPYTPPQQPEPARNDSEDAHECSICGYEYNEATPFSNLDKRWECPICGSPKDLFQPVQESIGQRTTVPSPQDLASMVHREDPASVPQNASGQPTIYECGVCGNTYDEYWESAPFAQLSDGWECPVCSAPKSAFAQQKDISLPKVPDVPQLLQPKGDEEAPLYECGVCGNLYDNTKELISYKNLSGEWTCPVCGSPKVTFQPTDGMPSAPPLQPQPANYEANVELPPQVKLPRISNPELSIPQMYRCISCGYTYDENNHVFTFGALNENWNCPRCAAPKSEFVSMGAAGDPPPKQPVYEKPQDHISNPHDSLCHIYECGNCGNRYDENTQVFMFDALGQDWKCPSCGAEKAEYTCVGSAPEIFMEQPEEAQPEAQQPEMQQPEQQMEDQQPEEVQQTEDQPELIADDQPAQQPAIPVHPDDWSQQWSVITEQQPAQSPLAATEEQPAETATEDQPAATIVEEQPAETVVEEQPMETVVEEPEEQAAAEDPLPAAQAQPAALLVYECSICGNIYDEAKEDCAFDKLSADWECPVCGAAKIVYEATGDSTPAPVSMEEAPVSIEEAPRETVPDPELIAVVDDIPEIPDHWGQQAPAESPDLWNQPSGAKLKDYVCPICGHLYSETQRDCLFIELDDGWKCPVCSTPKESFVCRDDDAEEAGDAIALNRPSAIGFVQDENNPLAYPAEYFRNADSMETCMDMIHEIASTGKSIIEPMRTQQPVTQWNDVLFLGAQLNPFPLHTGAEVDITTTIGKKAEKPFTLDMPVFVTHMSFGALSQEMKLALAEGSARAKTATCSGEGGMLEAERQAAYKYIFEYVPNKYSVTPENLKRVDAIEIKIGQGTKPGMGGHLPGSKVTSEIAALRGATAGEDILSPSRFYDVESRDDLRGLVNRLREESHGRPIGIKLAAGHIEYDLEVAAHAGADFVTLDGRGGGTGSSPKFLKDNSSVPTIYALYRARKYMNEHNLDFDLIITGGLRTSGDVIKAISMGADAVAMGTAMLMAAACMQYRVCDTGNCPTGSLTQDPELRKMMHQDAAAQRVANYLEVMKEEIKQFCRISGHEKLEYLGVWDICTTSREISDFTNIPHV